MSMGKNTFLNIVLYMLSAVLTLMGCGRDPGVLDPEVEPVPVVGPDTVYIVPNAVTDYDGNSYDGVWIGGQLWMKENLRTTHYADGVAISYGGTRWSGRVSYYYDNDTSSLALEDRGYLYNWPAVMHGDTSTSANPSGVQGVCPDGWHVPSLSEWYQLSNYVANHHEYWCGDNYYNIAKALASSIGWNTSTETCAVGFDQSTNNVTGFSAMPAGCFLNGGHTYSGGRAFFWSTEGEYGPRGWSDGWGVEYDRGSAGSFHWGNSIGLSVRCICD